MRRGIIGARYDPSDNPLIPAYPGIQDEFVFLMAVSIDCAVKDLQTFGADTGGLHQHAAKIVLAKGETAKLGKLRLLPAKPPVFVGNLDIRLVWPCSTFR